MNPESCDECEYADICKIREAILSSDVLEDAGFLNDWYCSWGKGGEE